MYERILVPTDGSVGTAHVALQAVDLAQQYGATVHVLHVVDADVRSLVAGLAGEDELEARGRTAVERLEQLVLAHDVAVETAIVEGHPAETILAHAEEIDADLIVAGTHGRTGMGRRVIGSVAERIVRHAPCPVMTIRLPETDETVEDEARVREIASDALASEGTEATVTDAERQVSVWVVEAEGDEASYVVYVDPVTQRASVIE